MEKELIKKWHKRFSSVEEGDTLTVLKEEINESSAYMVHETINHLYGDSDTIVYKWLHDLYIDAKDAFENKDWLVDSAFKVDEDFFVLLKYKNHENFYLEASTYEISPGSENIYVNFVELTNKTSFAYLKDENFLMEKEEFLNLLTEVANFLIQWVKTKSDKRIKLLITDAKMQIIY